MTTTLIVRDATLAIHGSPEKRGEPREHLRLRIAEVAHLDPKTAEECAEVLGGVATGELADPEVLEGLLILSLAHARLAETAKLEPTSIGRRLATRLEREGKIEHALAVLELLLVHFPGHEALERDVSQLMRRQGRVEDLVARTFERAKRCIAEGRPSEGAGWLREVLKLDPAYKDAARLLRDLRFRKVQGRKGGAGLKRLATLLLCLAGIAALARRELGLAEEFGALPGANEGSASSLERRLATLDGFVERHPVWHGALGVLSERSDLRVRLALLADKSRQEREVLEREQLDRLQNADLCRKKGLRLAQNGDVAGAIAAFAQALEFGGPAWEQREHVARDLADLEHLSENP